VEATSRLLCKSFCGMADAPLKGARTWVHPAWSCRGARVSNHPCGLRTHRFYRTGSERETGAGWQRILLEAKSRQRSARPCVVGAICDNELGAPLTPEFTVIYERDDRGWWVAAIHEVPGAFSQGRTQKEARENALDALQELMAARRELALSRRPAGSVTESLALVS
jgi:predicted RNase H-like HicB family nuclease